MDKLEISVVNGAGYFPMARRAMLTRVALAGAGLAGLGLGLSASAQAATTPQQPEAESGHTYPMPRPNAHDEMQWRMGVIGPAMLSLVTSELAVDRASDPAAKEFANFELREAIAVTTVLKELATPVPPMDAASLKTRAMIEHAARGAAFDRAYMKAQLANHEFLRDLTTTFLSNSTGTSMAEMQGRHMATLAQSTFKEHVVHCKRITQALGV